MFVSPTNLHCSQTIVLVLSLFIGLFPLRIYTALKLTQKPRKSIKVCFPYEFTLLSNCAYYHNLKFEFVSPTNLHCSQTYITFLWYPDSFVSPTNLHCSQTSAILFFHVFCLFPLRIYTALKLNRITFTEKLSLFPLRIYTALKPIVLYYTSISVCFPYEFTLLSNYLHE